MTCGCGVVFEAVSEIDEEELRIFGMMGTYGESVVGNLGMVTRACIHSTNLGHWWERSGECVGRMIESGGKTAARTSRAG